MLMQEVGRKAGGGDKLNCGKTKNMMRPRLLSDRIFFLCRTLNIFLNLFHTCYDLDQGEEEPADTIKAG